MSIIVNTTESSAVITVPLKELEKYGLSVGDEMEVSKNENNEIVLRSISEAERKRKFEKAKNEIFEQWHDVFVELAKGADDKNTEIKSDGKFVLFNTKDGNYKFVLRDANGKIIFESSIYNSRQDAQKAIDSLKSLPVEFELKTV